MNGLVAFAEEHQAANATAALKQRLAASARVLRDSAWATVAVRELVPGDVVRVRLGNVVPADLRVLPRRRSSTGSAPRKYPKNTNTGLRCRSAISLGP